MSVTAYRPDAGRPTGPPGAASASRPTGAVGHDPVAVRVAPPRAHGRRRATRAMPGPQATTRRGTRPASTRVARRRRLVAPLVAVLTVLLAVGLGGWEARRLMVDSTPMTLPVTTPTADGAWGRLIVLRTAAYTAGEGVPDGAVLVVVDVRLARRPGASEPFDPSRVRLVRPDGIRVPATLGTVTPVDVTGAAQDGRLGFVTTPMDGAASLAVADGAGREIVVRLRPAVVVAAGAPPSAGPAWRPHG